MTEQLPNDPSSVPGATPATGSPATGNTSVGATPTKTPTTLEEALAKLAELERHATNKEEQASRHGKDLTAAQKRLAEYEAKERQAQEATLSEVQKATKKAEELQQRYEQEHKQHISALVKLAASSKGIIDPDLAALAIADGLEYDDKGMPSNLDKLLEDLVKNKPYLAAKPAETQATPAQTAQRPQFTANNPGRQNITPPGQQLPPGQRPSLFNSDLWRK
jgi:hypothetical protein